MHDFKECIIYFYSKIILFFLSLCYKNDNIQKLSVSYYMMIIVFQNTMNHTQFLDAGAGISEDILSD